MAEQAHVPKLVHADSKNCSLVMTRLPGKKPETLSSENIMQLRCIADGMLKAGVARHSMPIRDILIDNDQLGMVDFERISLRRLKFSPFWLIACIVTKYHMLRLIVKHQPDSLSRIEYAFFSCIHFVRAGLQPLKETKDLIRRSARNALSLGKIQKHS